MRLKLDYKQTILIPERFLPLFWDCPHQTTFMEKFIKRILDYGNFEEIKWVYQQYPEATFHIVFKYPDIRRGVKFWINLWSKKHKS